MTTRRAPLAAVAIAVSGLLLGRSVGAKAIGALPAWFGGRHRGPDEPAAVPRQEWDPEGAGIHHFERHRAYAREIAAQRAPVVFTGSPSATAWKASVWMSQRDAKNCSASVLGGVLVNKFGLRKLKGVRKHDKPMPVFFYEDRTRLMAKKVLAGRVVDDARPHKKISMYTNRFLNAAERAAGMGNASSWYYTAHCERMEKTL